jgi:two-component system, NarL family, response regulator LiaR
MANKAKIRVMIVDDHSVVRSGLGVFLKTVPDMELVGEAEDGEQAVAYAKTLRPEVILMDLMMPGMDGVTATRLIKEYDPSIQVIALTSFQDNELVQSVLKAGAIGYLMKNVTSNELEAAVRSAKARKMVLAPEAAQALVMSTQQAGELELLTEREYEVLKLMANGLSNAKIAEQMVVSLSTIKYHVGNILLKLGVDNRVAAVTIALQKKLI